MATKYRYSISIQFTRPNPNLTTGSILVPYLSRLGYMDAFHINKKSIRIIADRDELYEDNANLWFGKKKAISIQIYKAIEYYYITSSVLPKVSSITIMRRTLKSWKSVKYGCTSNFQQPLPNKGLIPNKLLNANFVQPMLGADARGVTYRIFLSYWLKSVIEESNFSKFSNLWRAFNAIFRYVAGSSQDSKGLQAIENIIYNNYSYLTNCQIYGSMNYRSLKALRWGFLINTKITFDKERHNIRTGQDGMSTNNMMTHYTDDRIIHIWKFFVEGRGIIQFRLSTLQVSQKTTIINYLHQHYYHRLGIPKVNEDKEVFALLITKYAYFLRNSLFHGAVEEVSFKMGSTPEDTDLEKAKEWLYALIEDMVNNNLI